MEKYLNSKEIKEIRARLSGQFGFEAQLPGVLFQKEDDLYLITREAADFSLPSYRTNSLGLYIGEFRNDEIRLSIEGSQIIGPHARKNVLEISKGEARAWIAGDEILTNALFGGFVIVKHDKDFMGCGRIKDGKLLNFVPKARRLQVQV